MAYTLGLSAFYHDSAAALAVEGRIIAAAQEERFSRCKHDAGFPTSAVEYCLREAGISPDQLAAVAFYERPAWKFGRLVESHLAAVPAQFSRFEPMMSTWLGWKLSLARRIRSELHLPRSVPLAFSDHHRCHAASAFRVGPFRKAAIVTIDAVGEWTTTAIHLGSGSEITPLKTLAFPHSLGLLYSAFTALTGFEVNEGEYKVMGLAPLGQPRFVETIFEHLLDLKDDGSFRLRAGAIDLFSERTLVTKKLEAVFQTNARRPDETLRASDRDLAASIQRVSEIVIERIVRHACEITGQRRVCFAGGVALNGAALGRLLRTRAANDLWVQPAAGDAGCAIGAALEASRAEPPGVTSTGLTGPGVTSTGVTSAEAAGASSSFDPRLGPSFEDEFIAAELSRRGVGYQRFDNDGQLLAEAAQRLARGEVVAWFQDRMEFGPRALGSRSLLADPRRAEMQAVLNRTVKHRESFRPFAPAVLHSRAAEWFSIAPHDRLPWMSLVVEVRPEKRCLIPAVTHVDGTARLQTVDPTMGRFHRLLDAFDALTGCPVLVNTSFNVAGEPIACTPEDALRCFASTPIDALVIGDCLVLRHDLRSSTRTSVPGQAVDDPPPWSLRRRLADGCRPLRWLIRRLVLAIFYWALFVPTGTLLRWFGYDPLHQRDDRQVVSYWSTPRPAETRTASRIGVAGELATFLCEEKKWWLAPILIVSVVLMLLVAASVSPVAPFVYTLF